MLGDLEPTMLLATGASQSAMALTSYLNGVQTSENVLDGFLVHSRGGSDLGFDGGDSSIDVVEALRGEPVGIGEGVTTPVVLVQTEGDMFAPMGYLAARQFDSRSIRIREITGSAHADRAQLGGFEEMFGLDWAVNDGQQRFVLRTALRELVAWVGEGTVPVPRPPLEIERGAFVTDEHGNVRGGVRTPCVDAPVELLSGVAPDGAPAGGLLLGRTEPLPGEVLSALWSSREGYLDAYREATDRLIADGVLLADDREEILADARPHRLGAGPGPS